MMGDGKAFNAYLQVSVSILDRGILTKRIVVLFHGNGGEALDRTWLARLIPARDITLVLAEYPGYGSKLGTPGQDNFL